MTDDLHERLTQNKADWLAHTLRAEAAEHDAFAARHDGYFARYGPNFMAHVYRAALERVLHATPAAGRDALLATLNAALHDAIETRAHALPTAANCAACQASKW